MEREPDSLAGSDSDLSDRPGFARTARRLAFAGAGLGAIVLASLGLRRTAASSHRTLGAPADGSVSVPAPIPTFTPTPPQAERGPASDPDSQPDRATATAAAGSGPGAEADLSSRPAFALIARRLALAWLALLVLMLASLGSAYLRLGAGNVIVGLAIAAAKTALVVWFFMELRRASAMVRIVAAAGLATLLLLMSLSFADYATRRLEPARWQSPQQIVPLPPVDSRH